MANYTRDLYTFLTILHVHVSSSHFYGSKPLSIFHGHWNLLCKYFINTYMQQPKLTFIPQLSFKFCAMLNTENS